MLIKSVRLKNIRSYTDHKLEFPKGTILLSGDIGAGKSTVLFAIEFALFGIVRGQLDGSSLLRHGADRGEVELNFRIEDSEITIKRSLKRSKEDVRQESGSLTINGGVIVATPVELKSKIIELLGYPKEALTKTKSLIYRYTVYTPQEEMRRILTEDAAARKETLRTVFGVDRYSRAAENARFILKILKGDKRVLEAKFEGIEHDREKLSLLQTLAKELEDKLLRVSGEMTGTQNKINENHTKLKEFEKDRETYQKLRQEIAVLNAEITAKSESMKKNSNERNTIRSQINSAEKELKEQPTRTKPEVPENLIEVLESLRTRFLEASTKKATLEQQVKQAKDQQKQLTEEVGRLEKKVGEAEVLKKDILDGEAEINNLPSLNSEIERLEKKTNELQKHIGEHESVTKEAGRVIKDVASLSSCPLCRQKISDSHRHEITREEGEKKTRSEAALKEVNASLANVTLEIKHAKARRDNLISLKSKVESLKREVAGIKEIIEEINRKKNRLMQLESVYSEATIILETLRAEELKAELDRLSILKKSADEYALASVKQEQLKKTINELVEREEKLGEEVNLLRIDAGKLTSKLNELSDNMSNLSGASEKIVELTTLSEALREQEKKQLITISSSKTELEGNKRETESLDLSITGKQNALAKSENVASIIHWIDETAIPSFVLMEQHVLGRVYHEFNDVLRAWFAMLLEDETMSCRLSQDFAPIIEQNGYDSPIDTLSGGERTSIALAYRLALNRVINDLISSIKTNDLLILDEPTDGFSSEQLDRVRHVLAELGLSQVIIVSHEQKIESFVDHIIRISKTQHNSTTA
ncbi:MAG: SMC family ATPase [Nanoarchaeota archaeon]